MSAQADETIPDWRYEKTLTEDELDEERRTFTDLSLDLARIEFEKSEAVAAFNVKIKALKQKAEVSLSMVRTGRTEVVENVYQIADFAEGRVGIYNQFGDLLSERNLKRSERGADRSLFGKHDDDAGNQFNQYKTGTNE